jgi:hypothetical protein
MKSFSIEELEKSLKEIDELVKKEDVRQNCEKVYMIVESCIKILSEAEKENLKEEFKKDKRDEWLIEFLEKQNWNTDLLWGAAYGLDNILYKKGTIKSKKIVEIWIKAWNLHKNGFHENLLKMESVINDIPIAREMFEITKKHLGI